MGALGMYYDTPAKVKCIKLLYTRHPWNCLFVGCTHSPQSLSGL